MFQKLFAFAAAFLLLTSLAQAITPQYNRNFSNVTNQSVFENIGKFGGTFVSDTFGGNDVTIFGTTVNGLHIFGVVMLIFLLGFCFFLKTSVDITAAVLFPAIIVFTGFGWLPWMVAAIALIAAGGVLTLAFANLFRR